jgi:hypothetical protein
MVTVIREVFPMWEVPITATNHARTGTRAKAVRETVSAIHLDATNHAKTATKSQEGTQYYSMYQEETI